MKKRYFILSVFVIVILIFFNSYSFGTSSDYEDYMDDEYNISNSAPTKDSSINYICSNSDKIEGSTLSSNVQKLENGNKGTNIFSELFSKISGIDISKNKYKKGKTYRNNYEGIIILIILIYMFTEICEYLIMNDTFDSNYYNTQQFKNIEKNTLYKEAIVDDKEIPPSQLEFDLYYYEAKGIFIMT